MPHWPLGVNMQKILSLVLALCLFGSIALAEETHPYGVFLGMDRDSLLSLHNYDFLVLDAAYLNLEDVQQLKAQGNKQIFSYLNLGAIENFRPYYEDFLPCTLGNYEDWPEERWINVAEPTWQAFLRDCALAYKKIGIDGLFIDNCDVYYHFPTEEIYQGLENSLSQLHNLELPLLINGGDAYVKRCMDEGKQGLLYGINQETVFTAVDFKNNSLGLSKAKDREYFQDYIESCAKKGLAVFLLEYSTDSKLQEEIQTYCQAKGFAYYIANSIELDRENHAE